MKSVHYFVILAAIGVSVPAHAYDRWTGKDVTLYCHNRFGDDDQSHGYQACIARNNGKIGRDKSPGEIDELKAARDAGVGEQQ